MYDLRVLTTGFRFPESPRWHEGQLWVADWQEKAIVAVDLAGARHERIGVPSAPCCFDWSPDGQMRVVAGGDARVLRLEADGSLVPYADLSGISDRPWNEIVVDGRGNAYVNAIGFSFPGEDFVPGVVALVTPDGGVRQVADGVAFPNGMAVTPDNATLILAESWAHRLTAFDIAPDGDLTNRRVWAEVSGYPDGICLDAEGAVWYADVPNRQCVRVREGGEVADVITLDRGAFACTLGGPDRRTLFMVTNVWNGPDAMGREEANGQVMATVVSAAGDGWPCG